MASRENAYQSAQQAAQRQQKAMVVYRAKNGQWMFCTLDFFERTFRMDIPNHDIIRPTPKDKTPLPHLSDVFYAFSVFHAKTIKLGLGGHNMTQEELAAEWKAARDNLHERLDVLGLADKIDWTER